MNTIVAIVVRACLLCILLPGLAQAAETSAEKLEKYRALKLPELVKRAQGNDALAQFELGSRFNYGRNAPKSDAEALKWLRRAAESGQPDAQRLLAVKLYNGYDGPPNQEEARRWALKLADGGDVAAQMMLANMYANGEGGARDLVQAYRWYDIAAASAQRDGGDADKQQSAEEARDKMAGLLLPEEEARAQALASEWWLAKQGVGAKTPVKRAKSAKPKPKAGKQDGKSAAKPGDSSAPMRSDKSAKAK
jgi:hypothetical protein